MEFVTSSRGIQQHALTLEEGLRSLALTSKLIEPSEIEEKEPDGVVF